MRNQRYPDGAPTDGASTAAEETPGDNARVAARLAGDYLLRGLGLLNEVWGGDMFTSLLTLAIVQVNIAHLHRGSAFADSHDPPPDAIRRPASISAISVSLGMPYETVRRHVKKLVDQGVCDRVPGGVIVPARSLQGVTRDEALAANLANLRRLYRDLRAVGVDLD